MATDIQRSRGRSQNYKLDRGGAPAEGGPFTGIVMSNVDPTRSGRLRVYIEAFSDGDQNDDSKWTTVDYLPQYFGSTPQAGAATGPGSFPGNRNSYGMWWTPPDIGVTVVCIFINGDRNLGYYIGVVPDQGANFMVPGLGASKNFVTANDNQAKYFAKAPRVPTAEINVANPDVINQPRFFDSPRPVQSVQAAVMFQQGLINDINRGPIGSSAQRESPSQSFGFSTPGRPIFQGGFKQEELPTRIDENTIRPQDMAVIGRLGGHSLVMDDGATDGSDQLVRLRTAKGHEIVMHDSAEFFYIIHANGQTWLEFGKEGTVDLYSTNSVNVRTQGTLNLHADQDINIWAGNTIKMRCNGKEDVPSSGNILIEANQSISFIAQNGDFRAYAKKEVGVASDGKITLVGQTGSWGTNGGLVFKGSTIDLNGPAPGTLQPVPTMNITLHPEVTFDANEGWKKEDGKLPSIVTRAPTHEPWPGHSQGVNVPTDLQANSGTVTPSSTPVPNGTTVTTP